MWNIPQINEERPKDHNIQSVELRNIRILTNYVQNLPRTWVCD